MATLPRLSAEVATLARCPPSFPCHQREGKRRNRANARADAVDLYVHHPAVPLADPAAEVATEVRLLQAMLAELAAREVTWEETYRAVDPKQLAWSLPGIAEVSGPVLVAVMGRPARFRLGRTSRPTPNPSWC